MKFAKASAAANSTHSAKLQTVPSRAEDKTLLSYTSTLSKSSTSDTRSRHILNSDSKFNTVSSTVRHCQHQIPAKCPTPIIDPRFKHRRELDGSSLITTPSLLHRMQEWPSRFFGSTLIRSTGSKKFSASTDVASPKSNVNVKSRRNPVSEFVSQLIESQTNTPRLELKRNYNHNQQIPLQTQRSQCQSFSSLTGSALQTRSVDAASNLKKKSLNTPTNTIDSDNLSIVSSCLSFLDEHFNSTTGATIKTSRNVSSQRMETTNEYSEPFDYLTTLPLKKQE